MAAAASVPAARFEGLTMTEADGEVVVYDKDANHIHQLNAMSAAVWRQCDGQRSVDAVADAVSSELGVEVSADAVKLALTKLADANLLETTLDGSLRQSGQSRRSFLRKVAIAGAVPAVVSISAPMAAAAATGNVACSECSFVGQQCNCTGVLGAPIVATCIDLGVLGIGVAAGICL